MSDQEKKLTSNEREIAALKREIKIWKRLARSGKIDAVHAHQRAVLKANAKANKSRALTRDNELVRHMIDVTPKAAS